MKKMLLAMMMALAIVSAVHAETLTDYLPGHSPDAKNVRFALTDGVLSMEFGPGNGFASRAWMRRYHPLLNAGEKLRLSMMVKTTDISDPRAKVGFLVQAMGENHRYLGSANYTKYFPAVDFAEQWKPMEFIFTMPDPNKVPSWKDGVELMITFEALAQEGKAEFKDFKAEKLAVAEGD